MSDDAAREANRRLPDDIPFERWVRYVFDHPVLDPWWWFQESRDDYEHWDESAEPARTLEYLIRLFKDPSFLLGAYTSHQIDQGLYFLVNNSCSDHMFALRDETLPWAHREVCFHSMFTLYRDLMAPLYGDEIVHSIPGACTGPTLNIACFMWWDVIPIWPGCEEPDQPKVNDIVLELFRNVLQLKSEACVQSALHGLGEWHSWLPDRTEPIVRAFLRERQDISPALRAYAEHAAIGDVQ